MLTSGRDQQLARYELALEATRRPELRQALVSEGARVRAMTAVALRFAGISEPEQRAADFAAYVDGLLFDQIAGAGNRQLTVPQLRARIRALLTAITSTPGTEL